MMKKSYTFADRQGGRLYIREAWKDAAGKTCRDTKTVETFDFSIFLPGKEGENTAWKSIYGGPLSEIKFSTVAEFNDYLFEHKDWKFHGMNDACAQYIQRTYAEPQPDLSLFSVLNIDIEVEHSQGFPEPKEAKYEVLSITMKRFGQPALTLGLKPLDMEGYVQCEDEIHLLHCFMDEYEREYADLLTGWNVETFDIPYLINRMRVLGIEELIRRFSPFNYQSRNVISDKTDYRGEDYYEILGVTIVDYLELYKKFTPGNKESYRLDYIANEELGEGKIDYSEFGNSLMKLYELDFNKFVTYNIRDVELVERLDDKLQFLSLLISITFMTRCRIKDAQATVKPWDTLLNHMLVKKGMQPPPHPNPAHSQIVGGYVKEPVPGLKSWVITLDLASLYPNIIRTLNMSPETLVVRGDPVIEELLAGDNSMREEGLALAANGSQYTQNVPGILAEAMTFVLVERQVIKKQMLAKKSEREKMKKRLDELRSRS